MRIGLVCPYTWDTPGGVKAHVQDLAEHLIGLGHEVSVLAPVDDPDAPDLPPYLVSVGRAVPVPYNGSVARLCFGPLSLSRTRRWVRDGRFDIIHIHEPNIPSVSMLAIWCARGAVVVTFHLSRETPSIAMAVFEPLLLGGLEKVTGRIAVSPAARTVVMEHLGGDAVLIPNGVDVARFTGAPPLPDLPDRPTVVFLGRIDEERKGLAVLLAALPEIVERVPDVLLLVAGPGESAELMADVPLALHEHVRFLGTVSEQDKPSVYASGDLYCAPNTRGESFGIVLAEAMSAGTPVVASDLPAFRRVLRDGECGVLFRNEDPAALAAAVVEVLGDEQRRAQLRAAGSAAVRQYDWSSVAGAIVEVYETARVSAPVRDAFDDPIPEPDPRAQDQLPLEPSKAAVAWRKVVDSLRVARPR